MMTTSPSSPNQVEIPRLSASVAKVLIERSPLHAWQKHRLLGGGKGKSTEATEDGKILEALMFGYQDKKLVVIDSDSYRTNYAKEAKEGAIRAGKVPVLAPDYADYAHQAGMMLGKIHAKGVKFNGSYQDRIIWNNGITDCSGQLDHLDVNETTGEVIIDDLKCVADASPAKIQRMMVDYGYDIQGTAYPEALECIEPLYRGRVKMRFIFVEKEPPYAVSVVMLGGSMRELGKLKWARACATWAQCLKTGVFPDYSEGIIRIEALPWQLSQANTQMEEV